MKLQKIFYVLALGLLILTLSGATAVFANGDNDTKTTQTNGATCKPISECTPEERAACKSRSSCDTQSQKCDPSACSRPSDTKKDDSGI